MSHDEPWQAFDEHGEAVPGRVVTHSEGAAGALHGAAHVWIWRGEGERVEILLQERAKDTSTWPNYLDTSVAGHIDFAETPIETAVRETGEELRYHVEPTQLQLLFTHRQNIVTPPKGIIENEWQWIYGLHVNRKTRINFDNEIDSIIWLTMSELEDLVAGKRKRKIVPHGEA